MRTGFMTKIPRERKRERGEGERVESPSDYICNIYESYRYANEG